MAEVREPPGREKVKSLTDYMVIYDSLKGGFSQPDHLRKSSIAGEDLEMEN